MRPTRALSRPRWHRAVGAAAATLGVLSLAVTAFALAARWSWVAELFTHFRVQLVAGQLVLLAALLAVRKYAFGLAVAAGVLVNGWFVYPVLGLLGAGAAVADAPDSVSVMTVNVLSRNHDGLRLVGLIERERPDVVIVVEFTPEWQRLLDALGKQYPYRVLAPEDGSFGLALYSRWPLEAAREFALESTVALEADVAAPGGVFHVVGVHLKPPTSAAWAAERARQLEALAARRAEWDGPLVVAGDFNLTPYSPYFKDLLAATKLRDTLHGHGLGMTWPTYMPLLGIPIDHCLVSAHFELIERRHLPEIGSDHYPVLVRLRQDGTE